MSGDNHTPGPWKITDSGTGVFSSNKPLGQNGIIAICDAVARTREENEANARLIAAAPDLLKELEAAVTWIEQIESYEIFDPSAPSKHELLPQLRAAIAKARGTDEA